MISLSFDVDWAPDGVLSDTMDLLSKEKVMATFFSTHRTPILSVDYKLNHEIGIHPNLMPNFSGAGKHYEKVIDEIIELHPTAKGVRFHSLGLAAPVLDYCYQSRILYDSSIYTPVQMEPFYEYTGILRIPFQYSDLQMVIDNSTFKLNMENYISDLPLVIIFHPIHVFLNTYSIDHYNKAKLDYKDFEKLKTHVNKSVPGVRDLLKDVLKKSKYYKFITLNEVYNIYK